jgi:hypothetical protein
LDDPPLKQERQEEVDQEVLDSIFGKEDDEDEEEEEPEHESEETEEVVP